MKRDGRGREMTGVPFLTSVGANVGPDQYNRRSCTVLDWIRCTDTVLVDVSPRRIMETNKDRNMFYYVINKKQSIKCWV